MLVLDNCEHVVDAVAEMAEVLLKAARGRGKTLLEKTAARPK
jgi:predicted ATPase